jgi:hypothetical protein
MNRIGLFAMLAALTVPSAYAATRFDPAIPSGVVDQQVQPAGELAKPEAAPRPPRLVQNEKRHAHDADARACLDQATTNKAIHRCSLKYRSHASHDAAPVKKASARPKAAPEAAPAAPIAEMTKPPTAAGKAAPPKPADTAKAAELVKPVDVTKAAAVPKTADTAKPEAVKSPTAPAPAAQTPPPPAKAPEPAKK